MGSITSSAEGQPLTAAQDVRFKPSTFLRSRSGAAATEFALSVMILVTFLFGIISFGWIFFLNNNMETAAREGARRMAVAGVPFAGTDVSCTDTQAQTSGTAENIVCSMLPNWGGVITVNASTLCPAVQAVRVQVSADGQDVALADIFGFFNGKTVSASVDMYDEGACAGP